MDPADLGISREYWDRCQDRIKRRDAIIKDFVASQEKFVSCSNCHSNISSQHAKQWYNWHKAQCLICHSSLLPADKRQALKDLLKEADEDYEHDKKEQGQASSRPGWAPVRDLVLAETQPKKKKWWWPFNYLGIIMLCTITIARRL